MLSAVEGGESVSVQSVQNLLFVSSSVFSENSMMHSGKSICREAVAGIKNQEGPLCGSLTRLQG